MLDASPAAVDRGEIRRLLGSDSTALTSSRTFSL
jgi:hypothetical protein